MSQENHTAIITPRYIVERLKQKARKLKKEQNIPHHLALDLVAKENNLFHHWHHVTESAAETKKTEDAYNYGLIVGVDIKEALDSEPDENYFIRDEQAISFLEDELRQRIENYIEIDDEFNPKKLPNHQLVDKEELEEDIRDGISSLIFYRYQQNSIPQIKDELLNLIHEHFYFQPDYIWLKGKLIE